MTQEALKQALEALESHIVWFSRDTMIGKSMREKTDKAIAAIKEALAAQPEQEPNLLGYWLTGTQVVEFSHSDYHDGPEWQSVYTTPPAAQPAPVKFKCTVVDDQHPQGIPLEQWGDPTAAQRPWVDLTDEEISVLSKGHMTRNGFARNVLAKSKEKNNG